MLWWIPLVQAAASRSDNSTLQIASNALSYIGRGESKTAQAGKK